VYSRHRRWSGDGTWAGILDELRAGCDLQEVGEWTVGVDSTVVRAHQHAAGARHDPPKDIPEDILAPVLADPTRQASTAKASTAKAETAPHSVQDSGGWVELQQSAASAGGRPPRFDAEAYRQRNTAERAVNKLKAFRTIALRTDKREYAYQGTIDISMTATLPVRGAPTTARWPDPPARSTTSGARRY